MKKFFDRVGTLLHKIFGGAKIFEKFLEDHVDVAIAIISKINQYLANPVLTGILDLLPEKYKKASQDQIAKWEQALVKAINALNISADCFTKPTTQELLLCFIDALKKRSEKDREGTLRQLASLIVQNHTDNQFKDTVINTAIESRVLAMKFNA